jgi:hypothetical protein
LFCGIRRKIGQAVARQRFIIASVIALALVVGVNASATHIPQTPPVIVLDSKSPTQRAVLGSFCVDAPTGEEELGVTLCADAPDPEPRWLSVVRPGERVTIWFRKTLSVSGTVYVYKRGCEDQPPRRTFELTGPRTGWNVPSGFRGRFELDLFASEFATVDGRHGDTGAALGMLVSKKRDRGLIPNRGRLACGEPH